MEVVKSMGRHCDGMKILTFYLPQYHVIPENDEWWGKGYTEWVNVKRAKPLFQGHVQPREPLNGYYDLSNPNVMTEQMNLARQYGIGGFCFYHYWFMGKQLLEKPVDMLLDNKKADLPFCLAWANEPWTRTWYGPGGERQVLIDQEYGDEITWGKHFAYLKAFFKDERYIKVDNKPMFIINRMGNLTCANEMLACWNKWAREMGFDGMFVLDMVSWGEKCNSKYLSGTIDFEPGHARRKQERSRIPMAGRAHGIRDRINHVPYLLLSYSGVCNEMLRQKHSKNEFRGIFVDYDETPRHGSRSIIFEGSTPEKFRKYLAQTIKFSQREGNEYVFINAWNEWGEGNYLEPDTLNGYQYLEAVRDALKETGWG